MNTVILVILILLLVGAIPGAWPHSKDWGPFPMGAVGLILVIILLLMLAGCIGPVAPARY